MNTLIIDGNLFSDLNGFYEIISYEFMPNEDWKIGTLDGLNDILYGVEKTKIIWKNSKKSANDLGFEYTKQFLEAKIAIGKSVYNIEFIEKELFELNNNIGHTLFEIILEIFQEHKQLELILE